MKTLPNALRAGAMTAALIATTAAVAPGCLDRPLEPVEPRTTSTIVDKLTQSSVDKIDLLIVIDNSRSMADKQEILKLAVPDFVGQLVNPLCVDKDGVVAADQPTEPTQECPVSDSKREFDPILDIHIGVLTSSIGGHGATGICEPKPNDPVTATENDKAHLIDRADATDLNQKVDTWEGKGFLVWDPSETAPTHTPQGETVVGTLIANLSDMVSGSGEKGCGYEAQLEAWYRFLIEPAPYDALEVQASKTIAVGTDQTLLNQRADFLRPDSLLAIVMLTDENDCSIMDAGIDPRTGKLNHGLGHFAADFNNKLPAPRPECAVDPNDPCCASCGQTPQPSGCPDVCSPSDKAEIDESNQRCYDQKRRFGIDFLWPIERYSDGLSNTQVADRDGNIVLNPIFTDLVPEDDNSNIRDSGLVFLAGIIGVPWQDIARRTADGIPDLFNGLDNSGKAVGGFQSGSELATNGTWDVILGDPSCYTTNADCKPTDPFMHETDVPRTGANPITGDMAGAPGNAINGGEFAITKFDDLQYACRFELTTPKDCSAGGTCDCPKDGAATDNPLCDPNDTSKQTHAKAYPGIRELQVLKKIGTRGIVGSICPAQLTDATAEKKDYGYRPAIGAIVERLKQALGGQCLPRSLKTNAEGQVPCLILEARRVIEGQECNCNSDGRQNVTDEHEPAQKAIENDPVYEGLNCFCEITQTVGEDLAACRDEIDEPVVNASSTAVHGWCYIDATTVPSTGNPEIVAGCPDTQRRLIRFVGGGAGQTGATLFITCTGE